MKYSDLLKKFNGDAQAIPYPDLLSTFEWKSKRQTIIKRDNNTCKECNISPIIGYPGHGIQGYIDDVVYIGKYETRTVKFPNIIRDDKGVYLQVHHRYYLLNKLPWEIDDTGLVTLCRSCHENIHETTKINFYLEKDGILELQDIEPCQRCKGRGYISQYKNVQNGICFECLGKRFV